MNFCNDAIIFYRSISSSGSPVPWSMTPFFGRSFSDDMRLYERFKNAGYLMILTTMHYLSTKIFVQNVVRSHLGASVPDLYELSSNTSFVIQIGHHSVTYPRPYLPNVLEAGCLHCKPPKPLPKVSIWGIIIKNACFTTILTTFSFCNRINPLFTSCISPIKPRTLKHTYKNKQTL